MSASAPASAVTVEATIAAIEKQFDGVEFVEKKAYHRIALDRLTLGYVYLRGRTPGGRGHQADGTASTTTSASSHEG